MNAETDSTGPAPEAGPERRSRVGLCYVQGPANRPYRPGDRAFNVYRVVQDEAAVPVRPLCGLTVTVENAAGQRFPVPACLIDRIVGPCPPTASSAIPAGDVP